VARDGAETPINSAPLISMPFIFKNAPPDTTNPAQADVADAGTTVDAGMTTPPPGPPATPPSGGCAGCVVGGGAESTGKAASVGLLAALTLALARVRRKRAQESKR
jgi:MYXO-CTERM domain-containing protein